MSPTVANQSTLAEVLAESGWADIDELFEACVERGAFSRGFLARAVEKAGKAEIRRILRSGKVKDEAGNTIKVASILIDDGPSGKPRRVYKQETLFEVGDCVQVVSYWNDYISKGKAKRDYYVNLSIELHGPEIQSLLPLPR